MDRMVYSPKAHVFTKDRKGQIRDLSPYVVSGEVRRVVNAVSSANVVLRNPEMIFTKPDADGLVTFMPMDPITIYLERLKGFPVRVFTGFLDTTPYLQLYPGTIQIEASCTLKRLQYTYFDPALPYTQSFLGYYGWVDPKASGSVFNLNGLNDWAKGASADAIGKYGDGSIAELLAATLIYIGMWEDNGLYIEKLPVDLFEMIATLQAQKNNANKAFLDEFNAFLKTIIGAGSYGSPDGSSTTGDDAGGGPDMSTGAVKGEKKIIQTIMKAADRWGVPAEYAIVTCYMESGFRSDPGSGNGIVRGYYQWDKVDGPPGSYAGAGVTRSKKNGCYDLGFSSDLFCEAMHRNKKKNPSMDWHALVEKTQGVNQGGNINNPLYRTAWDKNLKYAKSLKSKYGIASNVPVVGNTLERTSFMELPAATETDSTTVLTRASTSSSNKGDSTSGSWGIQPGVPTGITKNLKDFMSALASFYDKKIWITTTTNHDYLTTSGNVSDHNGGNAADLGSAFNKWESAYDAPEGFRVATAAYRAAGYSYADAVHWANTPNYLRHKNGKGVNGGTGTQILWRVPEHHDHVHVGVKGDIGKVGTGTSGEVEIKINYDYTNMLPNKRARAGKPYQIVLHSTEGDNAPGLSDLKGLGSVLKAQGFSVHIGIDGEGNIARYVKDTDVAFHVAGQNEHTLGIEQVGHAAQDSWPKEQTDAAAKMIAFWANKYDIPIRHIDPHQDIKAKGVLRHMDFAGITGNDHTDPGEGYPLEAVLDKAIEYAKSAVGDEPGDPAAASGDSEADPSVANAFAVSFNFPTVADSLEAVGLTGDRSLMNDQPLLPFIQQLCDASLRQFQSLPDGRFYAFFPDHFGEMMHHPPYWEIDDIEVLNGGINLSDDALVTHMYVVGDTTFPNSEEMINRVTTSGVVTVFDAFLTGTITGVADIAPEQPPATNKEADKDTGDKPADTAPKGMNMIMRKDEAAAFLNRFGGRPAVEPMSMIKSHFFEFFVAYQRFLLAWSRQFISTFEFTFMPEIYPGGKVGFRDHGLQMYVEDVTHSWNYETGFITTANLSAPSVYGGNPKGLPPNMVRAIVSNVGPPPDDGPAVDDDKPDSNAWQPSWGS